MVPENKNLKIVDTRRQPHAAMSPLSPDACRYSVIMVSRQRTTDSRQKITLARRMSPLSPAACRNTAITDGGQRLADGRQRTVDSGQRRTKTK